MGLGKSIYTARTKLLQLQSCPICSGLGESALDEIAAIATTRTFVKGESLMQEGDSSSGFFLVLSGKVRVYKSSSSGKEKVLLIAEKGMTFGESALFGKGLFLENAVAITDTTILKIPRAEFLNALRSNPELSFQVMESLCNWIRRLSSSVEDSSFLSAKDKVANYLVELVSKSQSSSVSLPGKKKDIADQLGLAPETLSRVLHDLSDRQIINLDKRSIQVLDLSQLEIHFEREP